MMQKILRTEAITVHNYVYIPCYVSAGADKLRVELGPPGVVKRIKKTIGTTTVRKKDVICEVQ